MKNIAVAVYKYRTPAEISRDLQSIEDAGCEVVSVSHIEGYVNTTTMQRLEHCDFLVTYRTKNAVPPDAELHGRPGLTGRTFDDSARSKD
jgi:hypothetical protein